MRQEIILTPKAPGNCVVVVMPVGAASAAAFCAAEGAYQVPPHAGAAMGAACAAAARRCRGALVGTPVARQKHQASGVACGLHEGTMRIAVATDKSPARVKAVVQTVINAVLGVTNGEIEAAARAIGVPHKEAQECGPSVRAAAARAEVLVCTPKAEKEHAKIAAKVEAADAATKEKAAAVAKAAARGGRAESALMPGQYAIGLKGMALAAAAGLLDAEGIPAKICGDSLVLSEAARTKCRNLDKPAKREKMKATLGKPNAMAGLAYAAAVQALPVDRAATPAKTVAAVFGALA